MKKKFIIIIVGILIIGAIIGIKYYRDLKEKENLSKINVLECIPPEGFEQKIKEEKNKYVELKEIPDNYNIINAINDKCVISTYNNVYNKNELDNFLENVKNKVEDKVRCISSTVEGDIIITDIIFKDDIFEINIDYSRDQFATQEDRIIKTYTYSNLYEITEDNKVIIKADKQIEGENLGLNEIFFYRNDVNVLNDYESKYLLKICNEAKGLVKKITDNENISKLYDYDIYYSGFDVCKITIDDKEWDLEQVLSEKKVTMEQIINQAELDKEKGIIFGDMIKDGGSLVYYYPDYTITKKHWLDGNVDVYISLPIRFVD